MFVSTEGAMSKQNDRSLRFYHEVLGLEHLHYGLWAEADVLSVDKLKEAQQRYENYLIENLPNGARRILDVGCGTSAMCARMHKMGLEVEGMSPDITQKRIFAEKLNIPFHHCCFEDFSAEKKYDCIVMSESAQYIPYERLFKNAAQCVGSNGYLMVCDYFVLNDASGTLAKSGHNLKKFMDSAARNRFKVIKQEDLTEKVTKTLDVMRLYVDKTVLAFDIVTEKFRTKHPHLTRFLFFLFRKKRKAMEEQMELLDSAKFKQNKKYMFLLFQLQGA